jgi:hypothetical protein
VAIRAAVAMMATRGMAATRATMAALIRATAATMAAPRMTTRIQTAMAVLILRNPANLAALTMATLMIRGSATLRQRIAAKINRVPLAGIAWPVSLVPVMLFSARWLGNST